MFMPGATSIPESKVAYWLQLEPVWRQIAKANWKIWIHKHVGPIVKILWCKLWNAVHTWFPKTFFGNEIHFKLVFQLVLEKIICLLQNSNWECTANINFGIWATVKKYPLGCIFYIGNNCSVKMLILISCSMTLNEK